MEYIPLITLFILPALWWIHRQLHKVQTNCIPSIQREQAVQGEKIDNMDEKLDRIEQKLN